MIVANDNVPRGPSFEPVPLTSEEIATLRLLASLHPGAIRGTASDWPEIQRCYGGLLATIDSLTAEKERLERENEALAGTNRANALDLDDALATVACIREMAEGWVERASSYATCGRQILAVSLPGRLTDR